LALTGRMGSGRDRGTNAAFVMRLQALGYRVQEFSLQPIA
jgi:hypothetical protein